MATTAELDAQIAQLRQRLSGMRGEGISGMAAYNNLANQIRSLQNQRSASTQQQVAQQQQAQTQRAEQQADQTRQQMLGLGQSGIDRLSNDSTDQMVRSYLQGQMGAQTLDPNNTPFGGNVPQYTAQGYTAQGYNPTTGSASSWEAAQMGAAPQIGGGGPWNDQTIRAYMNDASSAAVAGESARNQMIRDAILQSGGNASDPSLAGAYAESLTQRNDAQAKARNSLNQRATTENFAAQRQADLANQQANMSQMQFNAANQQQANASNASLAQQMGMANMGAQNQAAAFNAQNQTAANQYLAGAQNQAGMFNTQNQMQGRVADFNAGNQARMYNQQQQAQAANQLGGYNNQRQNMLTNAQQSQIGLLGQQRFQTGQTAATQQSPMPSFQQFQTQAPASSVTYAPGYFGSMTPSMGNQRVTSVGGGGSSGTTTSFQNGYTGTPWNQQASQYVNRTPTQGFAPMSNLPQLPGIKQPMNPNTRY